ncbi:MAG: Eco57I restriction-modification methylase domain-containing protein [Acidobacteriota bacterium]
MLPGVTGTLIPGAFLEDVLVHEFRQLEAAASRSMHSALHRVWTRADRQLGPASSQRAVLDVVILPLVRLLGYELLHLEPHGNGFVGALGSRGSAVAVIRTTPWAADLDAAWRDTVRAGRAAGARWGLVCTGRLVRIVDASRAWSRRVLDFDLSLVLGDDRSATAFWMLLRRAALDGTAGDHAVERLAARADRYAVAACDALGGGVLDALASLVTSLDRHGPRGSSSSDLDTFDQALTIVYRLLFLLFAEARGLVPTWHRVYRDAYSVDALCHRGFDRGDVKGVWAAFQAMSRLAHAGCRVGDLVVTAFNGRLFSPAHTPLGEAVRLPDTVMTHLVRSLATTPTRQGRRRVCYADLGVEQLGSVYESILEHEPRRIGGSLVLTRTSRERKASGSFYTPRVMTDFLVRRVLCPLVDGQPADRILALRVLDPAMGSGAFLVSACRYLAAALERALGVEGQHPAGRQRHGAARRAELRRLVAEQCLYGVDSNPRAVQLARVSLWLTTLDGKRPLSFLDHHLAVGDSLVGARLEDLWRSPDGRVRGADPRTDHPRLFDGEAAGAFARHVVPDRYRLAIDPADSPSAVRDKEATLARLSSPGTPLAQWKAIADLWCAGWFWPAGDLPRGVYLDMASSRGGRDGALSGRQRDAIADRASATARSHRFFHWELEFPEVFFTRDGQPRADGGFDAVIGNPPWDVLRANPEDDRTAGPAREDRRAALRFFRRAGVYRYLGPGHLNRYQLFLERACQLARSGGRLGLVLPSGLATDHGSGSLRRALADGADIERVIGFDNRGSIFPIHRDVKFLLLTATLGGRTERVRCSFGRSVADWLDDLPDAAREEPSDACPVSLTRSLLESWDRDSLTWPMPASPLDLSILEQTRAAARGLGEAAGWGVSFGRELNATDDRPHFRALGDKARRSRASELLPVIEGKHLEPFRLTTGPARFGILPTTAARLLGSTSMFRRHRLAYRDVASATNRLTLISAILPPHTVSTHTVFCLRSDLDRASQYCLMALLNSLVANFLVRLHVTTHVGVALVARLPVPRPPRSSRVFRELVTLSRRLEQSSLSLHEPYARLNAIVARCYQLTPTQYAHVVSSFPLLPADLRRGCVQAFDALVQRMGGGSAGRTHEVGRRQPT